MYLADRIRPSMLAEILETLGRCESDKPADHAARFWFTVYCLKSAVPVIRLAAAHALASIQDRNAAPYLRQAASGERLELLRSQLAKAASELEAL
jgi:hypothetical protein